MPFTEELIPFIDKPCFLETGTYKGDTVHKILNYPVEKCVSLEVSSVLFKQCSERFKDEPRVSIVHANSRTDLGKVIQDISTEITFWLDSHWSGTDHADTQPGCPILEELEQIKKHPIRTHTIMIDDIRLMNSSKNLYHGFDISLEDILRKIMEINPLYTVDYFDDNYEKSDILVASITNRPVCIHKYLTDCKTIRQPPGFADFLRGTLALYTLSHTYGFRLEVDRTHPLFLFLEGISSQETGLETIELLNIDSYDIKYKELSLLFSQQTTFQVLTNSFYTIQDGKTSNWGPIPKEARAFFRYLLTPSCSLESKIRMVFEKEYGLPYGEPYKVIHVRTGDKSLHENHMDPLWNEMIQRIKHFIKNSHYVLITDSSFFAKTLMKHVDQIHYWKNEKTHTGDLLNNTENALMDTLCDFFILSRSSEICYLNDSGFSHIASLVYDIPYTEIPRIKERNPFKSIRYSYPTKYH